MKHLLVPTDFSDNAKNAFEFALHIAAEAKAKISLLHSFSVPTLGGFSEENLIGEAESKLRAFKDYAAETEEFANLQINTLIERGFAADEIVRAGNKLKVDLIVMGTQGISGLDDIFFGSVTESVIEKAGQPVLAVPEAAKYTNINNIAFASSFKHTDLHMMSRAMKFADIFDATLTCIHITKQAKNDWWQKVIKTHTPEGFWKPEQLERLKFKMLNESNVSQGLQQYVEHNDVNILTMVIHKRSFLQKLFSPSLTKELAESAYVPLLALPGHSLKFL